LPATAGSAAASSNSSRARASSPEHEVAARKLEARRFVPRLQQDETLEREHALGRVARVHRRDSEQ
jgi:hypothetical protein